MNNWRAPIAIALFATAIGLAPSQEPNAPVIPSFVVRKADVRVVLRTIFYLEKVPYEVSPDVKGLVDLDLHDSSLKTALDVIDRQVPIRFEWREGKYVISLRTRPDAEDIDKLVHVGPVGAAPPRIPIVITTTPAPTSAPPPPPPPKTAQGGRPEPMIVKSAPPAPRSVKVIQAVPTFAGTGMKETSTTHHHRARKNSGGASTPQSESSTTPTTDPAQEAPTSTPTAPSPTQPIVIGPGEVNLAPDEQIMYVGREDTFRCSVRFDAAQKPSAAGNTEDIPTKVATRMRIQLWADPNQFAVDPPGPVDIDVPKADSPVPYFDYEWHVRPLVVGSHPIMLNTWIDTGGPTPNLIENKPYSKRVTVVFPDTYQYYAGKYWQWPTGTVSLSALGGFIASRRKTLKIKKKKKVSDPGG